MKYLLDTDTCIYLIKKRPEKVLRHFLGLKPGDISISSITLSELQYGVEKSQQASRNREALQEFLLPLNVEEYGENAASHYGSIRAFLEKKGKPIGGNDLFIAAHALALNIPLVTNNVREFGRIPGLKVENWV